MNRKKAVTKFFSAFLIVLMCLSCQTDELQPLSVSATGQRQDAIKLSDGTTVARASVAGFDLTAFSSAMNTKVLGVLSIQDRYTLRSVGNYYVYHNYDRGIRDFSTKLNESFLIPNFNASSFADNFNLGPTQIQSEVLPGDLPNVQSVFTAAQISILNSYFNRMYSVTSVGAAQNAYALTHTQINSQTFSDEDKMELIAVIEGVHVTCQNLLQPGQLAYIQRSIDRSIGGTPGGRTMSCNINWRSVMISGVVGLAAGSVRGAIVGGAGGTVALPGFGTVGGAIGGAVFGGTVGFLGGVMSGIAGSYLETCFRKYEFYIGEPSGPLNPGSYQPTNFAGTCTYNCLTEAQDRKRLFRY